MRAAALTSPHRSAPQVFRGNRKFKVGLRIGLLRKGEMPPLAIKRCKAIAQHRAAQQHAELFPSVRRKIELLARVILEEMNDPEPRPETEPEPESEEACALTVYPMAIAAFTRGPYCLLTRTVMP